MTKVFWLFGRSGVGKTTLGRRLHQALINRKIPVFYLDGDDRRSGLCSDLSYTHEARMEKNFPFDVPRPHERKHYIDTVAQNIEDASQSILELVQARLSDFAI